MDEVTGRSGELDRQQQEREPAEGADMPGDEAAHEAGGTTDLPEEAVDEVRRWEDVPVQEPEESTGIDAG
ncbi:MAG TPA: hypothetical protein VHK63_02480 [Candidatus Limnocylindria bacterium]|jgi:hypothetical protein|nr:hypothetical protein [Candidatus Limnocylindria bacterium]